ncbi:peroxiredoxin [Sphingomonas bacterium]|uniref:peroxiredoxin n=1 Tax=Sphingomonas bacterium TaxID=1895847 RepID=UPI001575660D|nr:peroxiredoxin [Sphingomonas bacterium]
MIRIAAGALALVALATPAFSALSIGARAPEIATQASLDGKPFAFSLKAALKKGPVVLYFYPAAFTKGCTIEAHGFADATDDFRKLGATVIGMSADPIDTLNKFSVQECRSKFAVGSATPTTISAFDVVLPVKPSISNRTSYVIAPDGKVIFAYSAMDPTGHITGTMDAVKAWRASHPKWHA